MTRPGVYMGNDQDNGPLHPFSQEVAEEDPLPAHWVIVGELERLRDR